MKAVEIAFVIMPALLILGVTFWPTLCALHRKLTMTPDELEAWELAEHHGEHDW